MSDPADPTSASEAPPTPRARVSERQMLTLAVAFLGLVAVLLLVPGVFTIDESNYLAEVVSLRSHDLHLPGTEGLTFSRELAFFDPLRANRAPGPISSTMPPLYALVALPFSLFGWIGLFLLNIAAWLATSVLLYTSVRRANVSPPAAAVGALAFALAGFSIEYAVGAWPHALAAFLCLSAFLAVQKATRPEHPRMALLAGAIIGLAAGIRYQHVLTAAILGLVVLASTWRRPRVTALYGLGLALPLGLSTVLNGLRGGIWNPISKGAGYFNLSGMKATEPHTNISLSLLARVLDFSLQPHAPYWENMGGRWTPTGALLLLSAVKKALLQSAPWITVVMVALIVVWSKRTATNGDRRALRTVSLLCAAVFGVFALAGTRRWDGWCHNQRYFFDLVPLFAFALAYVVERARMSWRLLVGGASAGILLALVPLVQHPTSPFRQLCLLYVPLALACAAAGLFIAFHWRPRLRAATAVAVGLALGWAVAVHLGDDLRAARALRTSNLHRLDAVAALLPDGPAALFAHQPAALSPLLLERDLIIADTSVDQGEDAPRLVAELLAKGRRVFALTPNMSERELAAVTRGRQLSSIVGYDMVFIELGPLLSPPVKRTP